MREVVDLTDFKYGIIKRADARDIPLQAATDSNNVDGDAPLGRLQGIPTLSEYKSSARGYNAVRSAWILDSSAKWNLVYDNGSNLLVITDWYSAFSDSGLSKAYRGYSFVVHNQECHIGCGQSNVAQWIGYIPYGQFGGSASGWTNENAALADGAYPSSLTNHIGTSTPFDVTKQRQYACSQIYDYTQESSLGTYVAVTPIETTDYITVRLFTGTLTGFSERITAVKLYCRELDSAGVALTQFRLITQTDVVAAGSWSSSAGGMIVDFLDYGGNEAATYEQETGISDSITSNSMSYYTLSCECNNMMFVGGCSKTEIPDASHMVFRSMPYRYDMFNWSAVGEFILLPNQPTAIISFNNKVWIFDNNNMYRLDPSSMILEEQLFGIGCLSQRSIITTPYGMFWCDAKNAYWHDGQTLTPIGNDIRADSNDWHGFVHQYTTGQEDTPIVVFSPVKSTVLFIIPDKTTGTETNVWVWHVSRKRWDCWRQFTTTCGSSAGAFTGKNGEIYLADGSSKLYDALGGSYFKDMYWISGDLPKDDVSQTKAFYKFRNSSTAGNSTIGCQYSIDKGSNYRDLTNTIEIKDTNGLWEKQVQCRLKVLVTIAGGVTNNGYIDSLSLIYRKMIGER